MPNVTILFLIIVIPRCLSGTIAAKKLKFWLQVVLGPPFATACREIRKSGSKSGIFCFYGRTLGSTLNGPESPILDSIFLRSYLTVLQGAQLGLGVQSVLDGQVSQGV